MLSTKSPITYHRSPFFFFPSSPIIGLIALQTAHISITPILQTISNPTRCQRCLDPLFPFLALSRSSCHFSFSYYPVPIFHLPSLQRKPPNTPSPSLLGLLGPALALAPAPPTSTSALSPSSLRSLLSTVFNLSPYTINTARH